MHSHLQQVFVRDLFFQEARRQPERCICNVQGKMNQTSEQQSQGGKENGMLYRPWSPFICRRFLAVVWLTLPDFATIYTWQFSIVLKEARDVQLKGALHFTR